MELESGGEILINNQPATKRLRRQIGYVHQDDVFLTHLTVKQSLQFAGEMSIPDDVSTSEKMEIVQGMTRTLSKKEFR